MQYQDIISEQSVAVCESLQLMQEDFTKTVNASPELMMSVDFIRKLANDFFIKHSGEKEDMKEISNFYINNIYDGYEIPVRLYTPQLAKKNKVIMFAHGGGWIQGNLETHDYLCRKMANILGIKVLAIDYRLAPENLFPIPLNDCFSVYKWCTNQEYGDIIISGDSAGGNLCAALCIKLSEFTDVKKPSAQLLFYPTLSNDFDSASFKEFEKIPALSKVGVGLFYCRYLGRLYSDPDVLNNKFVHPILESNMIVFPETTIISAECDVLLDGHSHFIKKLKDGGIEADHIVIKGAVHGFMGYGKEFNKTITHILEKLGKLPVFK